jgi:hypothetical protein
MYGITLSFWLSALGGGQILCLCLCLLLKNGWGLMPLHPNSQNLNLIIGMRSVSLLRSRHRHNKMGYSGVHSKST